MGDGGLDQADRELVLPEPAVEAEDELVQVLLQARTGDAVEGADQEPLEVADHEVHEGQPLVGLLRRGGTRFVVVVPSQNRQAAVGVAAHREAVAQAPAERGHLLVGDAVHRLGGQEAGPVPLALHCEQHGPLALGAAAALAGPLAAHQGVVRLHQPRQPVATVPVAHGAAQLAQHRLRGRPRDPDHLRQPQRRNAALVRRHQVDRGEPFRERQLRVLEHRPGSRRGLVPASRALAQVAALKHVRPVVPAAWADEAAGPLAPRQLGEAGLIGGELPRPIEKAGCGLLHGHASLAVQQEGGQLYSVG